LKELLIDKIKKAKDIEKMIENWWKENIWYYLTWKN
jgi:hypothetical protein